METSILKVVSLLSVIYHTAYCNCPDGFISHQQSCYKEFPIMASWEEAQTYCKAYEAHLVTVLDDIEESFVQGIIHGHATGFFSSGIFWLDGTDQVNEGTWQWNSTGKAIVYQNWKAGEPNNAGKTGENCLSTSLNDNFSWNDMPCANRYNFVCQTSPNDVNNIIG